MVEDYVKQMHLKRLGIVIPVDQLDVFTIECYVIISEEFARLEREEVKRNGKNNR